LKHRYDPSSRRTFVMLMADRPSNTDDLATQPMPVLKSAF